MHTASRTEHHIAQDLFISHLDVTHSDAQAQHLLELKLYRRTDLSQLVGQVLRC
jgi:hypothetical protein